MKNSAENNKTISISIDKMAELMVTADYCSECDHFTKGYKNNFCRYFNSAEAFNNTLSNEPCIAACKKYLKKEFEK